MGGKTSPLRNVQQVNCDKSAVGAHCWHYSGHDHSFDHCCFCKRSGEQIFGLGYAKTKEEVKKV